MTSFALKMIAVVSMFCDHFGNALLGHFSFLNLIGRLAFPIFAFQISEGYIHTKNIKKYFLRLIIFALISQIPFSLYSQKIMHASPFALNVFFTLLFGLLGIYLFDYVDKLYKTKFYKGTSSTDNRNFLSVSVGLIFVLLLAYIAELIHTDYGFWGVIIVFMFYLLKEEKLLTTLTFLLLCIIKYWSALVQSNFHIIYFLLILFTFLPIIFINEYNGKQGIKIKYLLYIFYPLHLLLLYFIF